ncbi:MAG TPA: S1C family serine protease, partial [Usitatibacter sp.]
SLAPPAATRSSRASAADDSSEGGFWPSALKYAIPVAVVVLAIWGWKRHKAPPPGPIATVVSVTRIETPADPVPGPSAIPEGTRGDAQTLGSARNAENIFAEISPSIVSVHSADGSGRQTKQGSGVVTGSGRVITNCHVVSGADQITVASAGETRSASLYVSDEEFDLCSLDVTGLNAPAVTIRGIGGLRTGQRVFAIGAPLGLELTISEGIVSSLRDTASGKVIQTTAPVSPGSSGGGLFDVDGKLVGIITFQQRSGQNLNFAVPADWIFEMRNRSSSSSRASDAPAAPPSAPAQTAEPTVPQMVVGRWWCFGSLSGRNGEYNYGPDGILRIASSDGTKGEGPYTVSGRRILYQGANEVFAFDIDSISAERMVQVVGEGRRLVCERRG